MQRNKMDRTISEYIHLSKYSRWLEEQNRRETWEETVNRYINFWEEKIPTLPKFTDGDDETFADLHDVMTELPLLREIILKLEAMPSMRSMMTAGKALERDEIAGYNCTASAVNHMAVFSEAFYILMNGCFDKDTLVKTINGDKKISKVTIDDRILTYDTENDIFDYVNPSMVFETPQSIHKEKIELGFGDGNAVQCTSDHEFFTTNRGWVKACELTGEDDVKNFHEVLKITRKKKIENTDIYWDMSVPTTNNYVLANGNVVHNCGFGFSVERQYTNQLPEISEEMYPTATVIQVRDSKIGWATALKELISMLYSGQIPTWDVSKVRPAGSRLKTFGGRASGPEPLEKLFRQVRKLIVNAKGRKLNSLECHTLMCHIANAVIVGSVRRSALISLSNLSDGRMRDAKSGQWWSIEPDLALSNNSVAYTEKPDLKDYINEMSALYKSKSGERGMWNKVGMKKKYIENGRPEYAGDLIPNPSLRKMTKVWTSEGIKPIYQLEGIDFNVRNQYGEVVPAECWKSAENLKLWNIDIDGNHTYQCSPQHKWAVFSDPKRQNRSTIIKKRADEIVEGDILIKNGFHDTISNIPSLEGDYDKGLLCGWIIGDGWGSISSDGYQQYGMIISEDDTVNGVKDVMIDILQDQCGWSGDFSDKTEINTCNRRLNTIMINMGFTTKENGLPSNIWKSSEDTIRGVIDGIVSSDGYISNCDISIKTSRNQLAKDISELLGFYGISNSIHAETTNNVKFPNGKVYDREYTSYKVTISGYLNIKHFSDVFKLTHRRKQSLIDDIVNSPPNIMHYSDGVRVTGSYLSEESDDVYDIRVCDDTATFQLAYSITGNCGEIALRDTGQACNLSEIIIRPWDTLTSILEKARAATILGTLQASLTNLRFLRKIWKRNMEEERLLGVSMTGIMDHKVFSGSSTRDEIIEWSGSEDLDTLEKVLSFVRSYCRQINYDWATKIGITPTGHVTCVKPSGCTTMDTKVKTRDNGIMSMQDIWDTCVDKSKHTDHNDKWYDLSTPVFVYDCYNNVKPVTKFFDNGVSSVYEIEDEDGNTYKFTGNHKLLTTNRGWVKVENLDENDDIKSF